MLIGAVCGFAEVILPTHLPGAPGQKPQRRPSHAAVSMVDRRRTDTPVVAPARYLAGRN
ncbi:hypothetical protein [Nitratidesulfovibrio sp.]|uniref:hypothetical protein n=1 Tax=Nitratidesulfovibrio sp. TaxID=2802297 RepID=UPI00333F5949